MQGRGIRGVASVVVAVLALTAPSTASAKTTRTSADHDLSFASDTFAGQLTSAKAFCERARKISLHREGADGSITSTVSGASGAWALTIPGAAAGDYYAVAAKKAKGKKGRKRVCRSARSNSVAVSVSGPVVVTPEPPPPTGADLRATNSISGPQADRDYVYEVTASNDGPEAADAPAVTIQTPGNFTVKDAASGCSPTTGAGATVVCDLASPLAPGDDEQITVEGFFTSAAAGGFSATADSATPDPQPVNDTATLNATATQCTDRVDNDGDTRIDFGTDNPDHGCSSVSDETESPNPQCSDGIDNDADGGIDYFSPAANPDFGCSSDTDDTEAPNPQCSNGLDDDGDTLFDMSDPGCGNRRDDTESPDPPPAADFEATAESFISNTRPEYTLRLYVENKGPSQGTGPKARLTLPNNFTVTSMSALCAPDPVLLATVNCDMGSSYNVGGSASLFVVGRFTSPASGTFSGTLTPASSPPDPNPDNDSDSILVTPMQCADSTDNDGDGQIDFPNDSGCTAPSDNTEN